MTSQSPWDNIPSGKDAIPASDDVSNPHRFLWAYDVSRRPTLLYSIDHISTEEYSRELPQLQSIDIYIVTGDRRYLALTLLDPVYLDIFTDFCHDLVSAVLKISSREAALPALINRCWRWHSFLYSRKSSKLSAESQQGLFAEISFLLEYLQPKIGLETALNRWLGPFGCPHDFSCKDANFEIKSTAGNTLKKITISSEHQLELPPNKRLYIICYCLERNPPCDGISLAEAIDELSAQINNKCPSQQPLLQELLHEVGYSSNDDYSLTRFIISDRLFFEVDELFPSIRRDSLDSAIVDVSYSLVLERIKQFKVDYTVPIGFIS